MHYVTRTMFRTRFTKYPFLQRTPTACTSLECVHTTGVHNSPAFGFRERKRDFSPLFTLQRLPPAAVNRITKLSEGLVSGKRSGRNVTAIRVKFHCRKPTAVVARNIHYLFIDAHGYAWAHVVHASRTTCSGSRSLVNRNTHRWRIEGMEMGWIRWDSADESQL